MGGVSAAAGGITETASTAARSSADRAPARGREAVAVLVTGSLRVVGAGPARRVVNAPADAKPEALDVNAGVLRP